MRTRTYKLTLSGLVIALYIVIMYFTQAIAFGQYQIRLATGLYGLSYSFPFLCVPLGLANMLSNCILGGDIVNGCLGYFAGFITSKSICILKQVTKKTHILALPIAIVPSLLIPIWLSYTLNVSYYILFFSLLIGQTIAAYTSGVVFIKIGEMLKFKWSE